MGKTLKPENTSSESASNTRIIRITLENKTTNQHFQNYWELPKALVLGSPVPRLKKDHNWTGPRLQKTGPAVSVF